MPPEDSLVEHPTRVCESTNLQSVDMPRLTYTASSALTRACESKTISALQFKTARYVVQAFRTPGSPRGFCIGDGTGVGKTRTAAAVALELASRASESGNAFRVAWVSCRQDLESDVRREYSLVQTAMGHDGGTNLRFSTYGKLRYSSKMSPTEDSVTFHELRSHLLAGGRDALLVLDEAHIARSPKSATGIAVRRLQQQLPAANVLYCTATAASDVQNLSYMLRLGLYDDPDSGVRTAPFRSHDHLVSAMQRQGPAGLELIALYLKGMGRYVCRVMAPSVESGAEGGLNLQPAAAMPGRGPAIQDMCMTLTAEQRCIYNACSASWIGYPISPPTAVSEITHSRQSSGPSAIFFRRLLTSFKAQYILPKIRDALESGVSVVITVQGTGAASCMSDAFARCNATGPPGTSTASALPPDAMDILVCSLGTDLVAEISGRTQRLEPVSSDGAFIGGPAGPAGSARRLRSSSASRTDAMHFQLGQKRVAIVSAAGGTGLSLHASSVHSSPRLHILLELPWGAEAFVQQCGRTHRTGQYVAPSYVLVRSPLLGDVHMCSVISRRLGTLGCLTQGDRNSCSGSSTVGSFVVNAGQLEHNSPGTLRMAALELLMRECNELLYSICPVSDDGINSRPVLLHQARALLNVGKRWHEDRIVRCVLNALLRCMDRLRSLKAKRDTYIQAWHSSYRSCHVVSTAIALVVPHIGDICSRIPAHWPCRMGSLPRATSRRCMTVMLASRHPECVSTLGAIPSDILIDHILRHVVCGADWARPVTNHLDIMALCSITRTVMCSAKPCVIYSRLMSAPLDTQQLYADVIARQAMRARCPSELCDNSEDHAAAGAEFLPNSDRAADALKVAFPLGVPSGCNVTCSLDRPDASTVKLCMKLHVHDDPHSVGTLAFVSTRSMMSVQSPSTLEAIRRPATDIDATGALLIRTIRGSHMRVACGVDYVRKLTTSRARQQAPAALVSWDIEIYAPGIVNPVVTLSNDDWPAWFSANAYLCKWMHQSRTARHHITRKATML